MKLLCIATVLGVGVLVWAVSGDDTDRMTREPRTFAAAHPIRVTRCKAKEPQRRAVAAPRRAPAVLAVAEAPQVVSEATMTLLEHAAFLEMNAPPAVADRMNRMMAAQACPECPAFKARFGRYTNAVAVLTGTKEVR